MAFKTINIDFPFKNSPDGIFIKLNETDADAIKATENGIYVIVNIINNKIYIGSTFCDGGFNRRWVVHKSALKNNRHPNKHLQSSWLKYGEDAFILKIIEVVNNVDDLLVREQFFMDLYESYDDKIGYNIAKNASAPMLGKKHSEDTKKKIGNASIGNQYSLGYKASSETKLKMSKNKNAIKYGLIQYDKNDFFIREWDSINDAVISLGLNSSNIRRACKNNTTCGSCKWKLKKYGI